MITVDSSTVLTGWRLVAGIAGEELVMCIHLMQNRLELSLMNPDELEERLEQELEIGEANNLSRIDILERKLGMDNSHLDLETRLYLIEKRFGMNDPDLC